MIALVRLFSSVSKDMPRQVTIVSEESTAKVTSIFLVSFGRIFRIPVWAVTHLEFALNRF